jgi:hypothetical protein
MTERPCACCEKLTQIFCAGCKIVSYCSKDCQKKDWALHKIACKLSEKYRCDPIRPSRALPAWAQGLSPSQRHEWIVDCYRMHVDDLYALGGQLVGLYEMDEATPTSIVTHFLVFAKMAVASGVLPRDWDWKELLKAAVNARADETNAHAFI